MSEISRFQQAMSEVLRVRITGLLLEESDLFRSSGVSLGGAVVIAAQEDQQNWVLSPSKPIVPSQEDAESCSGAVVNCHLDELIGLSLSLGLPIYCKRSLFNQLSIDATLERVSPSSKREDIIVEDEDDQEQEEEATLRIVAARPFLSAGDEVGSGESPLRAWEIYDPNKFFTLSNVQKREILRNSGVTDLPRPRLGAAALDPLLLDLMDDAVRSLVETRINSSQRGTGSFSLL